MPSRKNRSMPSCRNKRSVRRNRSNKRGGYMAPVNDASMKMSQADSLRQGSQYLSIHKGQYGGSAPYPLSVSGSTLPGSMVAAARTGPLDAAIASIQGMQDGGRRHKMKRRGSRRASRKHSRKHSRKYSRRGSRKQSRKHRGGSVLIGSPLSENSMLLPPGMEKQAALNYEWSMAKDPSAFAPKP